MSATPSIRRLGRGAAHYVFLHGSPGDSAIWEELADLHPQSATCWLLDLPDHGAAPDLSDNPLLFESNVTGSVRALRQNVTLVGHAFGAYLAGRIARRLGDQVSRLVLISGFPRLPENVAAGFTRLAREAGGERAERLARRLAQLDQPELTVLPYEQPARVIHGRSDPTVPLALGAELAALGRRAQLTTIETDRHMLPKTHAAEIAPWVFSEP